MLAKYPDLADKTVMVTGGSRGIGAATAKAFAAQGARVCVVGRDGAAMAAVVAAITDDSGRAMAARADVTNAAALAEVRELTEGRFGPIDVLAAFAGGNGSPVPTAQLTQDRWQEVIDTNLTSAFLTIQAVLPGMLDCGRGVILTMSSAAGRKPSRANLAYGVANAGLVMLTRQLAAELGRDGIRVNTIAPSTVRTEKVEANMPADMRQLVAQTRPLGRLATMDDVAQTALSLSSAAASFVTGVTVDL